MKPLGLRPFAWEFGYKKFKTKRPSWRRTRWARICWTETYEDTIVGPPRRGTLDRLAIIDSETTNMGQTVLGVFFGCEQPVIDLFGENDDSLLTKWEDLPTNKRGKLALSVASDEDEERSLIGFWVYDMNKVDLKGRCLNFAEVMGSQEAIRAREAWVKFAAWANELEGVTFEEPKFWLAPTEIA